MSRNVTGKGETPDCHGEAALLRAVARDLARYREAGLLFTPEDAHTERWKKRLAGSGARLVDPQGGLRGEALRSFWRDRLFVDDNPLGSASRLNPLNLLGPTRGERRMLRRCHEILSAHGFLPLLERHPAPAVGRPRTFGYRGCRYTHRWFKSVYLLGLFGTHLAGRLGPGFTAADIGAAFGIFPALLRREHPGSRHVLVDLPEMLLLARYFLGRYLPEARIAGAAETGGEGPITREFVEAHDFTLLHPQAFARLAPGAVDLVSSFACLGELKREFFDYYVTAGAFRGARYLFTANPVQSSLMFPDSDVTLLDYPVHDPGKVIHFAVSPAFFHPYARASSRFLFSYELKRFHAFFEYIGRL